MLIADGFASGRAKQTAEEIRTRVCVLVEAGLTFVQLRDHVAAIEDFDDAAHDLADRLRILQPDVVLVINSRRKVATDLACGIHVGRRTLNVVRASEAERPLGYSAHSLEDIRRAAKTGSDYATLSPIFPTATHPETQPLGVSSLAEVCDAVPNFPVFALGGITPVGASTCLDVGSYGVAVLSDLLGAADPVARLKAYRNLGVGRT